MIPAFRDREKMRYRLLRPTLFADASLESGKYRGKEREFCLTEQDASLNLHEAVREHAIRYFTERKIPWHDGPAKRTLPSNHLCSSQVACVNTLQPMQTDPDLLLWVFSELLADRIQQVLPMEFDDQLPNGTKPFLSFEWIGSRNFLGERGSGTRTRGANCTSADFAFRFLRQDGLVELVLGEWKYTEYYRPLTKPVSGPELKSHETRRSIYSDAFRAWRPSSCKLDYDEFFAEPFISLYACPCSRRPLSRQGGRQAMRWASKR